jgi:hypothetical protein
MSDTRSVQLHDPDVFSRGSLQSTFALIRYKDPALGLAVRNITATEPLPKLPGQLDNKNADHFLVALDSFQVRAIVEALAAHIKDTSSTGNATGMEVVAKSLIEDWMALAAKMIADLPDDQKPWRQ